MSVKIRLTRKGKKKQPFYRIVVANSRTPRDGKVLEVVGLYDPTQEPLFVELKTERIQHWLSTGAQPTETVSRLLSNAGLVKVVKRESSNLGRSKKSLKEAA